MSEVAVNVPFDSNEVKEIAVEEFRKRLDGLSPLSGGKEYAAFSLDFAVKIRLRRAGESDGDARETLAWGKAAKGDNGESFPAAEMVTAEEASTFESKDPNQERQDRNMLMTVESGDGKGGRVRRKARVKGK
jgi:hypothetical protein